MSRGGEGGAGVRQRYDARTSPPSICVPIARIITGAQPVWRPGNYPLALWTGADRPGAPDDRIGQHLDEHAADHRAGLEARLLCRPWSSTSRSAGTRMGDSSGEVVERGDERLEVLRGFGQRGGPDDPVELRVGLAVVERQAVLVLASSGRRRSPCAPPPAGRGPGPAACPRPGCTSGSRCRACRRPGGSGRRRRPSSPTSAPSPCAASQILVRFVVLARACRQSCA